MDSVRSVDLVIPIDEVTVDSGATVTEAVEDSNEIEDKTVGVVCARVDAVVSCVECSPVVVDEVD